jgi:signal transduction histidine kinase
MDNYKENEVKILVADDEESLLKIYKNIFCKKISNGSKTEELGAQPFEKSNAKLNQAGSKNSYKLTLCRQGDEAVEAVRSALNKGQTYAMAFLDVVMPPGPDGIWAAENIRALDKEIQIVIVTAYSDIKANEIERRVPPVNRLLYVQKPFFPAEIRQFASTLAARWQAEKKLIDMNQNLEAELNKRIKEILQKEYKSELADITTGTLHNVKNILNGIKVSSDSISKALNGSSFKTFKSANEALRKNIDNIDDYIKNNPKGEKLMQLYLKIDETFDDEIEAFRGSLKSINDRVDAIEKIVSVQQKYGTSSMYEDLFVRDIIEDAFIMQADSIDAYKIKVEKTIPVELKIKTLKIKLIHILINLIKNALEAMTKTPVKDRKLAFSSEQAEDGIYIKVQDTGCGISEENMKKLFSHGFTTREDGHGFGLHSCSVYMKEMGGKIDVYSAGEGKGTTFTLRFPFPAEKVSTN